jgi:NAD(P)-dependent dehydrogenase (short-subunit alcohol dehydrogenase family)
MPPAFDLNGKVALVTGAARGIGYETARQMHLRGASVALVDLDAERAREAAERIGERALGIAADVSDQAAVMQAVAEAVERFGGLDVAVANAGIAPPTVTTARSIPIEEWERVVEVNLMGAWRTARAALPQVSERKGQLVFIGSIYSFANGLLASPYAVSKAGVEALGRALRAELTPFGAGATIAYFGWVDTDLVQDSLDRQDGGSKLQDTLPSFLLKRITPDVAAAALVRGVEQRSPRVFAPAWWRYASALRGLINPIADRRMERHPGIGDAIRDAEQTAERSTSG